MKMRIGSVVAAATVACVGIACGQAEAEELIEITAADLPASAGAGPTGAWQSVGWDADPWHPYPGRATLILHHDLGRAPAVVLTYVAFDDTGRGAGLAAGDMARVIEVADTTVTIRNDTEADFHCRLVLE